jgi:hypothetical protein
VKNRDQKTQNAKISPFGNVFFLGLGFFPGLGFELFRGGVSLPKLIYLRNIMLIPINKIKQFAVLGRKY